jgi:hypothetical protein
MHHDTLTYHQSKSITTSTRRASHCEYIYRTFSYLYVAPRTPRVFGLLLREWLFKPLGQSTLDRGKEFCGSMITPIGALKIFPFALSFANDTCWAPVSCRLFSVAACPEHFDAAALTLTSQPSTVCPCSSSFKNIFSLAKSEERSSGRLRFSPIHETRGVY